MTAEGHARRVISILVAAGAILSAVAIAAGWGRDFASFYESAAAMAEGGDPYRSAHPGSALNINLPHVTALFVPLTRLPYEAAFAVWQAVQLLAWGALLRMLLAGSAPLPSAEFVAAAVLFPGTLAQIAQGQWGFVLAWLIGLAWRAQRHGREIEAGMWIGAASAIKPFVGLLIGAYVVQRRLRGAVAAVAVVAIASASGIVVLGPLVYRQWLHAASSIDWAGYAANASLLGFAERSLPPAAATWFWPLAPLMLAGTTLLACWRRSDSAAWWTVALVAALLVSPVGWLHYGWILAPGLLSLHRWPALLKTGLVLLWIPPDLLPLWLSSATIGLMLIWMAVVLQIRREHRDETVQLTDD